MSTPKPPKTKNNVLKDFKSLSVKDIDTKKADKLYDETSKEVKEQDLVSAELSKESSDLVEKYATDAKATGNFTKYVDKVQEAHVNVLRQRDALKKEQSDIKNQKAQIEKDRNDLKEERKELGSTREALNRREQKVKERELQIDNGEYTSTIQSLLEALNEAHVQITKNTEQISKENANLINEYLEKLNQLNKDKRFFETQKKIFEEETKLELEEKYESENSYLKSMNKHLEDAKKKLDERIEELENTNNQLKIQFGDKDPKEILGEIQRLLNENAELNDKIINRPSEEEFQKKDELIEELNKEIDRLRENKTDIKIAELRIQQNDIDNKIAEIDRLRKDVSSYEKREDEYLKAIDKLNDTIKKLTETEKKNEQAFQCTRQYDDPENGFKKPLEIHEKKLDLCTFAEYVQKKIACSNFYYDLRTIRIFISGLFMSNITILQGISGTGKTSLPREFAKAILPKYSGSDFENSPNSPYRICAIQSGWRDNMDLMGYYNSFENKYKETEFFKALYLANLPKYSNTLFFIILDEMNLSRPEHYFADFLSLLEQDKNERYITVNAPNEVLPEQIKKDGKLAVPPNVRFIGTANHDETTLEFAPKTYDRSNVIDMPKNQSFVPSTTDSYNISYKWLNQQFEHAFELYENYFDTFKQFIDNKEVKTLFTDKDIGVGNRFENQAKRFITVFIATGEGSVKSEEESLATAADHLITTRLLRSLKNKYELERKDLEEFKKTYTDLFKQHFKHSPDFAINLLDEEIKKKPKDSSENAQENY